VTRPGAAPSTPLSRLLLTARLLLLALAAGLLAAAPARAQELVGPEPVGAAQDPWEGRTVLSIEVEGERRYSEDRLRATLGLRLGEPYSGAAVARGVDYLWSLFQVRARVVGRPVPEGLHVRLEVVELPSDLEPRFIGYDRVKLDTLLEWAQLQDRRELYFHQVDRVTSRVLEGYRREGHYFAQVRPVIRTPEEGDDPDAPGDVIFEIIEGPRVNVSEVVVNGNDSLPDTGAMFWRDGLRHLAQNTVKGPSLFDWNGSEFVEADVQADLVAMRNVYRDRGYLNAVVELDRLEFSDDREWVTIHVVVDEGPRFRVTDVRVEGFELQPNPEGQQYLPLERPAELYYPVEELVAKLELVPGGYFLQTTVESDRRTLRDHYGKDGYIEHASLGDSHSWRWLRPELVFDLERAEVAVTYRLSQGKQVRIREVLVSGATHTRDRVIRREISVDPGQLADMTQISASVRRLRGLGYFSDQRDPLNHRDPYFVFRRTDDPGLVDIEFIVEEGRVVDFAVSGGVDSNDGLFGLVSLSMRNFDALDLPSSFFGMFGEVYRKEAFHGAGQTLTIQVSPGARRDQSQVRFVEPDIFGLHRNRISFTGDFSIFDRIYRTHDEKRTTAAVSFGRQLGFDSAVSLGYTARRVGVDDADDDVLVDPELYSLQQQVGDSNLVGLTLNFSHRNTDAAFNPRDGRVIRWSNEVDLEGLGSTWEMWSSDLSWDEYVPLEFTEGEVSPGLRVSTGASLAMPFGGTEVVPYTERIFLGGFNTLRGFRFRGVGPNSEQSQTVLGGESMLRASLEYRHPLVTQTRPGSYDKLEMFRIHFFVDAGVLGTDHDSLDLNDYRAAYGFGFALVYPIPLAFNFGWPLQDGPGDDTQVFSFNLAVR
jgi:outer membrane protein insertion porin family